MWLYLISIQFVDHVSAASRISKDPSLQLHTLKFNILNDVMD